jgi:hypothetical protein
MDRSRKRVLAKVGGLWGPEAQSWGHRWGEVQMRGLAWELQHPEARFYIKTKVIATTISIGSQMQLQSWSQCRIWCCGCRHHAMHGVVGAVVVPQSLRRMGVMVAVFALWYRGCSRGCRFCTAYDIVVAVAVIVPPGCHSRCCYATRGITGAVVVPHWCCCCCRCTVRGVAGAVVVPRWWRSHSRWAMHGVAGAVITPHVVSRVLSLCHIGVAVAIVAPCMVSQSQLLCRMGVTGAVVALRMASRVLL